MNPYHSTVAIFYCYTGTHRAEQYREVYRRFYAKLVQSLPLTDAHFRAALVSKQMFYGDLLAQVDVKGTNIEKSDHFLTSTIDSSLNVGLTNPFESLLQVMENFDSPTLKCLAKDINTSLLISASEPQTQPSSDSAQSVIYTRS